MSHRLQVLVLESLDRRIRKAANRNRLSAGAWARQAIERALQENHQSDPLDQLGGISVRDAVHAAVMLNHDISEIATLDEGCDALDDITRIAMR